MADIIRKARRARGFTQAQLAKRAGCGVTTIHRLENGSESVNLGVLNRICRHLGLMACLCTDVAGEDASAVYEDENIIIYKK